MSSYTSAGTSMLSFRKPVIYQDENIPPPAKMDTVPFTKQQSASSLSNASATTNKRMPLGDIGNIAPARVGTATAGTKAAPVAARVPLRLSASSALENENKTTAAGQAVRPTTRLLVRPSSSSAASSSAAPPPFSTLPPVPTFDAPPPLHKSDSLSNLLSSNSSININTANNTYNSSSNTSINFMAPAAGLSALPTFTSSTSSVSASFSALPIATSAAGVTVFNAHTIAAANAVANVAVCGSSSNSTSKPSNMSVVEDTSFDVEAAGEPCDNPHDPLTAHEYVEDIYAYLRRTESTFQPSASYMTHHTDINEKMRAILIDWLVDLHMKFRLLPETLFLAINILDRVLEKQTVSRSKLQLVGTTAMFVASKYEEICIPEMNDFIFISANFYSRDDMLKMESFILNALDFRLTVPTPLVFLRRFCRVASVEARTESTAMFLLELSLLEMPALRFPPSMTAAAALFGAIRICSAGTWTPTLRQHSGYTEVQLDSCVRAMFGYVKNSSTPNLLAIRRKYSSSKLHSVAKMVVG
eukprot:gnl/Hemi2/8463_TR2925_c0_g1_i1.p1 gnl/Hemi2/8463_TR2925_c0_g1~~gnl/Hemi2/8463_TR2925_c0_g1_i1.p1  ORF type:complete len:529 (-),score=164.51 gnl/Hemi2/8463_TR2925_c0_g1_i1:173-1759(-)